MFKAIFNSQLPKRTLRESGAGFTMIELMITITVVSLLAAIVFVVIDPVKRFGDTNNAQRRQNSLGIQKNLGLLIADYGTLPAVLENLTEYTPYMLVVANGSTSGTVSCTTLNTEIARIDIASLLTPYLGTLPVDPEATGDDTGYYITKVNDGSFYAGYCYEYSPFAGEEGGGGGWTCGDALTDERDSKTYATVLIGTQCWMAENINVGTMVIGGSAMGTDCPSAAAIEKYCYEDREDNCTSDGAIYKWTQAMCGAASCNGTGESQPACSSPVQGICPTGWHIPSHYEWNLLERSVCVSGSCATDFPYDNTTVGYRGTDEGKQLKVTGDSGFNFILNGYYDNYESIFMNRNSIGEIYSSTFKTSGYAWARSLYSALDTVGRYGKDYSSGDFFSHAVRCLKD